MILLNKGKNFSQNNICGSHGKRTKSGTSQRVEKFGALQSGIYRT
jgi:hypothetical protein